MGFTKTMHITYVSLSNDDLECALLISRQLFRWPLDLLAQPDSKHINFIGIIILE